MTAIETLKQWFSNLKKPTQEQFWAWLDSFWHKSEKIPMASVDGLDKLVEGTASAEQLSNHLNDTEAHKVLFDQKVDKVEGKELTSNDFTNEYKEKLESLHQVDISGLLPKGDYTGTAQDLKKLIDEKADKNHKHKWGDIEGSPADLSEALKKAVSNLQIGGRNLILQSKHRITKTMTSPGFVETYNLSQPLEIGKTYIFTYKNHKEKDVLFFLWNGSWEQSTQVYSGKPFEVTKQYSNFNVHTDGSSTEYDFELLKLERGNISTDWSPAPEDFNFYKGEIQTSELSTFKQRPAGVYKTEFGGGSGIYVNLLSNGSASSLEFYKSDWYPATRIGVRNLVDSNRFNDDGGKFRDLAWFSDVYREGAKCEGNTTLRVDHQNQVIFVTVACSIDLSAIQNMGSVSFRKVFDGGQVTFTCAGKSIIYTGDTTFNGKKGSTAVISIYENDCYIDIRNI
ncbi:hypothetical protein RCZ04_16920 [Capnocytophaga sp. HP1101]